MNNSNLLIIRIGEGLGNQLFEYAYARAWKEKGLDVRLDMNKTYDDAFIKYKNNDPRENCIQNFNITLPEIDVTAYRKYDYLKQETIKDKIIFHLAKHKLWKYKFYEEPMDSGTRKPVCLHGNYYVRAWLQEERYFKQIRNILLRELTPRKKIVLPKELRQAIEYEESIAVHVRRGDYIRIQNTLNAAYFNKAAVRMKQHYHSPLFVVFSEDIDWVKKNLDIGADCIYVTEKGTLQDYEELFLMSRCSSQIISNSTFSWWGAWLNQNPRKVVIAPRQPWLSRQTNIIPEEWVVL